ncbi:transposase domain-containing protein [Roseinatronobacter sp. S2]|uniref:transposase domain-containing protein n=1 Tax=Roseinatronobacter sp. S2 TaxID=3035471 RepID=UPI00358E1A55
MRLRRDMAFGPITFRNGVVRHGVESLYYRLYGMMTARVLRQSWCPILRRRLHRSLRPSIQNPYLKATLTAIANSHPQNRIDDLLPWNFKPSS